MKAVKLLSVNEVINIDLPHHDIPPNGFKKP